MAGKNKASKKSESKPPTAPANPATEPEPKAEKAVNNVKPVLPMDFTQLYPILEIILATPTLFPKILPVTVDTLGQIPPGKAFLKLYDNFYDHVCVFGAVGWNMKIPGYIEYYLYDPYKDADVYVNVVQTKFPSGPTCYPIGAFISVSGFLCGVNPPDANGDKSPTPPSTILVAYDVKPITVDQYLEFVFQARVTKLRIASGKIPKRKSSKKTKTISSKHELIFNPATSLDIRLDAAIQSTYDLFLTLEPLMDSTEVDGKKMNLKYFRYAAPPQKITGNSTFAAEIGDDSSKSSTPATKNAENSSSEKAPDARLMKLVDTLGLPFSIYHNHVPLTVTMLANNPHPIKDRFVWKGLFFRTVRTFGKIIFSSSNSNYHSYVVTDMLNEESHYPVIQRNLGNKTKLFDDGNLVEIYGTLQPSNNKNMFAALVAEIVTVIHPARTAYFSEFMEDVALVHDDIDELTQVLVIAKSYIDYRRNHGPPTAHMSLEWIVPTANKFKFINVADEVKKLERKAKEKLKKKSK